MPGDIVTISGYLQKKTRDGRWQKRWFETNGCFLTYYKARGVEFIVYGFGDGCGEGRQSRAHPHMHNHTFSPIPRQSKKMTKLLAALDLVQVGTIKIVETPEPGGTCVLVWVFILLCGWCVGCLKGGFGLVGGGGG